VGTTTGLPRGPVFKKKKVLGERPRGGKEAKGGVKVLGKVIQHQTWGGDHLRKIFVIKGASAKRSGLRIEHVLSQSQVGSKFIKRKENSRFHAGEGLREIGREAWLVLTGNIGSHPVGRTLRSERGRRRRGEVLEMSPGGESRATVR